MDSAVIIPKVLLLCFDVQPWRMRSRINMHFIIFFFIIIYFCHSTKMHFMILLLRYHFT